MINILPAIPEVEAHPPSLFTCRPRFAGSANQFHSHPLHMATTAINSLYPDAVHVKRGYAGQSASSTTKPWTNMCPWILLLAVNGDNRTSISFQVEDTPADPARSLAHDHLRGVWKFITRKLLTCHTCVTLLLWGQGWGHAGVDWDEYRLYQLHLSFKACRAGIYTSHDCPLSFFLSCFYCRIVPSRLSDCS